MKYVFLDDNYGIAQILMRDLELHPDCFVIYKDRIHDNRFLSYILRVLLSARIRKWINIPFKRLWFEILFKIHIDKDTKIIAMTAGWYHNDWINYVKSTYPHAKLVLLLRDSVRSKAAFNKEFKIEEAKQKFDLILSYDNVHDVPVYGLTYAPVYMSKTNEIDFSSLTCKYDLSFIGAAKDRLHIIHHIYQNCTARGLKSFFYIFRVKKSNRLSDSSIIYSKHYLRRLLFLQRELESNCILEILKGDAHSNTTRFWEAVIYNKKFYTNWKGVVNSPYYNPKYIRVFDNPDDLDYDFIKERIDVDYNYHGELSPIRYLEIFEQLL